MDLSSLDVSTMLVRIVLRIQWYTKLNCIPWINESVSHLFFQPYKVHIYCPQQPLHTWLDSFVHRFTVPCTNDTKNNWKTCQVLWDNSFINIFMGLTDPSVPKEDKEKGTDQSTPDKTIDETLTPTGWEKRGFEPPWLDNWSGGGGGKSSCKEATE